MGIHKKERIQSWSVTGGKVSKPMTISKIMSEPISISLQKTSLYRLSSWKNIRWFPFWLCSVQFSCSRRTEIKTCHFFSSNFQNTEARRNDIEKYMKRYAIENEMLKHSQIMLICSFLLEIGAIITPLFNFYLKLGLQCTKEYRYLQYSPRKYLRNLFNQCLMREDSDMKTLCQEL